MYWMDGITARAHQALVPMLACPKASCCQLENLIIDIIFPLTGLQEVCTQYKILLSGLWWRITTAGVVLLSKTH